MVWSFSDSFDCYAAPADALNGYWDSGTGFVAWTLPAGRFSGSQAISPQTSGQNIVKSSGQNDAVHHLILAFRQTAAVTGSTLGWYMQLTDGTTAQCSIVFRQDGAILLTSGASTGAVLDTYTGAFTVQNTWYVFEIEVVINNTTGSWAVRKNGNTVNDRALGSLDTQNSANAYANKIQVGYGTTSVAAHQIDDLYWRSDASSVAWMGDIKCIARAPALDASAQFSRTPTNFFAQNTAVIANVSTLSANNIRAVSVVAPTTGTLASLSFYFSSAGTGHAKMALYDATGASGGAGTLLASSAEITNPVVGTNVFSVAGGPTVSRGTTYWVALWSDFIVTPGGGSVVASDTLALTYTTSFPSTLVGFSQVSTNGSGSQGMNVTSLNAGCVNEAQQDATTSYVYDSVPGHADLYGIAPIASTPLVTHAVVTRAYMIKSDAGTRTAAVQLRSGGTTDASPTIVLTPSNWQWAWKHYTSDPAGGAWTAAAVNVAQCGPVVIA